MNLEQFGQRVKTKYPEYQDMNDTDVGQKILNKYPEYQDMVTVPTEQPKPEMPITEVPEKPVEYVVEKPEVVPEKPVAPVKPLAVPEEELIEGFPKSALQNTRIKIKGIREVTGEVFEIEQNALEALETNKIQKDKYQRLLDCLSK